MKKSVPWIDVVPSLATKQMEIQRSSGRWCQICLCIYLRKALGHGIMIMPIISDISRLAAWDYIRISEDQKDLRALPCGRHTIWGFNHNNF